MPKKTPKKAKSANPVGRQLIKITKVVLNRAKRFAAQGLTREQIAISLGMGKSTFFEKLRDYPELLDAVVDGETEGIQQLTNVLYQKAVKGDLGALKYSLNNRDKDNWKERQDIKLDVEDVTLSPAERKKRMKELLLKCQ